MSGIAPRAFLGATLLARSKFIGFLLAGATVLPVQAQPAATPADSARVEQQLEELRAMRNDMQRQMEAFDAKIGVLEAELRPGQVPAATAAQPSQAPSATAAAGTQTAGASKVDFEIYGFGQIDVIYDTERVDPDWEGAFRPSKIPTDEGAFGSDGQTTLSVRQSRLGAKVGGEAGGREYEAKFEFDLFGTGDDAGQTTFRLRHAYGRWGPVLGGQTDTLFMDVDLFPASMEYWGPVGMIALRNPQLRFYIAEGPTFSAAVAIEKPGNDIDAGRIREFDPNLGANIRSTEDLPDATAQVRYMGDWGHVQLSGILRKVGFETIDTLDNEPKGSKVGWGLNLGTVFNLDLATFRLGATYGEGIASYMNDGGTDLAPTIDPITLDLDPKAVPMYGITAYVDLKWSDTLTSAIGYSRNEVDNTNFQDGSAYNRGEYASANLLWAPYKRVLIGPEVLWGQRTDKDGESGDDIRLQFSFKVGFSSDDVLGK